MSDEESNSNGVATTRAGSSGVGKNEMVNAYLPGEDEDVAKTILDLEDPGRIAVLRQFDQLFPEVAELQPVLNEFLDQYLKGKPSIGGKSRDEYNEIFQAMFGGNPEESDKGAQLAAALGANLDDE